MPRVRPATLLGTRGQLRLIHEATAGLLRPTDALLAHIVASSFGRGRSGRGGGWPAWVPISRDYIRGEFGGAEIAELVERGVLEVLPYDRHGQLSREYRPSPDWALRFLLAGPTFTDIRHAKVHRPRRRKGGQAPSRKRDDEEDNGT